MNIKVTRGTVKISRNGNNEMDWFRFGAGEKIFVMLPGLSVKSLVNSAEGIASAYRIFSDDFTVYFFDRTKFLSENYTLEQLAGDTAEAMTALGIKDACVFGTSQGGMIAQIIAINHPELVSKLFLASTCARIFPEAEKVMNKWVSLAERGDIDSFCDCFIDLLYGESFAEKFGELIRLAHSDVTGDDFKRFVILGRSCDGFDIRDRLSSIRCPVMVVGAENDRVLTAQASVEIGEIIGCGCYLYGPEYGHCVFDEAPDYKDRIFKFFSEV